MNVLYLAPLAKPAIGGGSVYLDMLTRYFVILSKTGTFNVLTEKFPGAQRDERCSGRVRIIRKFPFRCGRSRKDILSYIAYVIQNMQFQFMFKYTEFLKIDTVVVHSSFHNDFNLLVPALKKIKRKSPKIQLICDVRDPKLKNNLKQLAIYDKIICCSNNVAEHISQITDFACKIIQIPVPIENLKITSIERERVLNKYGVVEHEYLFNGSGCSREKGILKLLGVARALRVKKNKLLLVVAGKKRFWNDDLELAQQEGWFRFLDCIPHDEVVSLASDALFDINLSKVDSMPRHSLEAMAAGACTLLPANVPEFKSACPKWTICEEESASEIARKLEDLALSGLFPEFKWEDHLAENIFPMYEKLLW